MRMITTFRPQARRVPPSKSLYIKRKREAFGSKPMQELLARVRISRPGLLEERPNGPLGCAHGAGRYYDLPARKTGDR
jgi:hypothetical protein